MENELFNGLLVNYTSLNSEEAEQLARLADEFPYSQVIHNLAARSAQDNNLPTKEKLLNTSAIYSTDRAALKSMMTASRRLRVERQRTTVEEIEKPQVEQTSTTISTDQLHEQLRADLATMQESKRQFELIIEQMESGKFEPLKTDPEPETKIESVKEEPKAVKGTEGLIEEIKTTKKKIKPEGPKQIEQIEIIDQFIKAQPTISRPKSASAPQASNDLSENSGLLGEHIVSETLVEILLKQGKKEKAIEVLKKLIWKFPQKKAYFAAQIEDLRK
ncbi:hypothetical protein WSM22_45540 [Cytophagales bacterium WSM2-2]|nr:hypothetical protein WSM22_45540 [Cytophagales bacterium WSM2-2]